MEARTSVEGVGNAGLIALVDVCEGGGSGEPPGHGEVEHDTPLGVVFVGRDLHRVRGRYELLGDGDYAERGVAVGEHKLGLALEGELKRT